MKPVFYNVFALLACLLPGCGGGGPTGGIPTLDLAAAIDNPRPFDLAEIAEKIEFIPLDDSTPDALLSGIGKMRESKEHFYIIDSQDRPVKIFDKAGKFVSTRGSIGRGPGEYFGVNNIVVDAESENLYVLSVSNTLTAYGADGRMFAHRDSLSQMGEMAWFDNRLIYMREPPLAIYPAGGSPPPPAPDSMTTIVEIYSRDLRRDGAITSRAKGPPYAITFGQSEIPTATASPNILSGNGTSLLAKEGLNDTVFHFMPEGTLAPALLLKHGRYSPPPEAFTTNPKVDWDRYYVTTGIFSCEEYTILTVRNGFNRDLGTLVFDGKEPRGGFSTLGPDGKPGLFIDGIRFTALYIDANRLVGYIRALDIVDNIETITNPDLKALAAALREESNPVIVVVHLK